MSTSTLTSKGQLTLPKAIRDELGLSPGDRVEFVKDGVGGYRLRPLRGDLTGVRALLAGRRATPATIEEMNAAIMAEAAKER